jgi:VanZ family protein
VAALMVLSGCVGLSLVAEFLEVFAPGRVPSPFDVVAQSAGAVLGIATWVLAGPALTGWIRAAATTSDRLSSLLTGYAAAWALVNLAPFDVTVDLGDLARRFHDGGVVVVPFSGELGGVRLVWDSAIAMITAVPLGVFGLVRGAEPGRRRSAGAAFLTAAILVVAIEAAQVFIHSHVADSTDVLFGLLGAGAGVLAGGRILAGHRGMGPGATRAIARWATAALVTWCVVIVSYQWLPYDFSADSARIRYKLARMSWLPFSGYHGSYLNAFNDVLVKVGLSIPFGLFAAFVRPRQGVEWRLYLAAWLFPAAIVFTVAELGQFFVPSRVPDPTDVLIGIGGSCAGLLLGNWVYASRSR